MADTYRVIPFDRSLEKQTQVLQFPETHDQWVEWYNRRESAYLHDPYSLAESKAFRLFRAFDPNGDIIAVTRRITRDIQHVVDTGAGAIAGGRMLIEAASEGADASAAAAVWKRSAWNSRKGSWAKSLAMMGRCGVEAVRLDPRGNTALVVRDPRCYRAEYDQETGTALARVVITVPFYEPGSIDPSMGVVDDQAVLHSYVRVLTPDRIEVYLDGRLVEEESGDHGLGVVPFVNSICVPYHADDEHGLWVGHGMDSALAFYNSVQTQVSAIGNRYANPQLVGRGVRFGEDSEVTRFGRMIGIPADADVKLLEPNFGQLSQLLAAAEAARLAARESLAEFTFAGAGANSSGEALRLRAAAFVGKYEEIRARVYADLARVTEYAVQMDSGAEYDPNTDAFTIEASPVMQPDRGAELDALERADKIGAITLPDKIRGLQRIGMIAADIDADQYAAEVEDRTADRATQFFNSVADEGA